MEFGFTTAAYVVAAVLFLAGCNATQARINDNEDLFNSYPPEVQAMIKSNRIDGKKTETRRLWPKGRRVKVGSIHEARLKMFEKDSTFARLRILDVSHEKLGEIDLSGAAAEGYPSVDSFIREFARINRIESAPENELLATPVWRVKFEVLKPDDA